MSDGPADGRFRPPFALLFTALLACGTAPIVSAGPSVADPADPFARLNERTDIVGYEFGVCAADIDCAPRGCGGAVCSPNDEPSICLLSPVAECLATVPSTQCGCVEGVCRWARVAPVMQCAQLAADRPTNRPIRGLEPPEMYPIRLSE